MDECLFCKIAKGEIPAKKVYEDANTFAFLDINPRNPGHTLVIPKNHYMSIMEIPENELAELIKTVKRVVAATKNATNSEGTSVGQSNGRAAGQVVGHIHFHVIPRFIKENLPSLEGFLQVKKMDDKQMETIAEKIRNGFSGNPSPEPKKEEPKAESPKKEPEPGWSERENELFEEDE